MDTGRGGGRVGGVGEGWVKVTARQSVISPHTARQLYSYTGIFGNVEQKVPTLLENIHQNKEQCHSIIIIGRADDLQ